MTLTQELWETFRKLAALEARTEDVSRGLERASDKIDNLLERLTRVEAQVSSVRENVRNEILADLKAEMAVLRLTLDGHVLRNPSPSLGSGEGGPS